MAKKFVVLHGPSTPIQDQAFLNWIQQKDMGWWHWLPGSWLIHAADDEFNTALIRDQLRATHPGVNSLVLEIPDPQNQWSGFGPTSNEKDMFKWIRDNWGN